ncbi:hypothetical protein TELCIR_06749, partial [Teladorsagia circumcincta]
MPIDFVEKDRKLLKVKMPDKLTMNGNDTLPESFDGRVVWKDCPSLRYIRDQSHCGSCWAVSAAETMSDRLC